MLLLSLVACVSARDPVTPADAPTFAIHAVDLPSDPMTSVLVRFEDEVPPPGPPLLVVEGPDGLLTLEGQGRAGWLTFRPDMEWSVGDHHVVSVFGMPLDASFTVEPFGRDPDFAGFGAGHTWTLTPGHGRFITPAVFDLLLAGLVDQGLTLEVLEEHDGVLDVRLVAEPAGGACVIHAAQATVDDRGRARWREPAAELPLGDGLLLTTGIDVTFGLWQDVIGAFGGRARLDLRDSGLDGEEPDLCYVFEAFGDRCVPCADGEEACVPMQVEGLRFAPTDREPTWVGTDLPDCTGPGGPLLDGIVPVVDVDFRCASGRAPGTWLLLMLPLWLGRRRTSNGPRSR